MKIWEITQGDYVAQELPAKHEAEQKRLREAGILANNYFAIDSALRYEHGCEVSAALKANKSVSYIVLKDYIDRLDFWHEHNII